MAPKKTGTPQPPTPTTAVPAPVPRVRDGMTQRLAAMGVPSGRRVSYVVAITGRAEQSVRRWFDREAPGLPDLPSFVRLCAGLQLSADELLGLAGRPAAADPLLAVACSVETMADALRRRGAQGDPVRVEGDEMVPSLYAGDLVFVDRAMPGLHGNGLYVLEREGRMLVRRLERRLTQGWVLRCDNAVYQAWELQTLAAMRREGLEVVGRVHGVIGIRLVGEG